MFQLQRSCANSICIIFAVSHPSPMFPAISLSRSGTVPFRATPGESLRFSCSVHVLTRSVSFSPSSRLSPSFPAISLSRSGTFFWGVPFRVIPGESLHFSRSIHALIRSVSFSPPLLKSHMHLTQYVDQVCIILCSSVKVTLCPLTSSVDGVRTCTTPSTHISVDLVIVL